MKMPRTRDVRFVVFSGAYAPASEKIFNKTMKKTSYKSLGIPAWFMQEFGSDIDNEVDISYDGETLLWKIGVHHTYISGKPYVAFGRGWKEFTVFHGIDEGQELKFTLVAKSHFVVQKVRRMPSSHAEYPVDNTVCV